MTEELKQQILESKVISFDIFDTLITRIVDRPEVVFELMENHFHIENFSNIRQEMQAKAGLELMEEKNYPHANMDEIYQYMNKHSDIKNTEELLAYEIKLEEELLYQNKEIYEIYQFAKKSKKRVVVTSDMYLDISDIKRILKKCGYKDFDQIYLSSKERKAKFNGELFDALIEKENVPKETILHIGDNYAHDYIIAKEKGIHAFHYKNTQVIDKSTTLTMSFHNGICRLLSLGKNDFWANVGTMGGLLYLGLYQELLKKKKDKIYFLARDGYNLYHLFQKFQPDQKVEYVYTSRRALLLGSIDEITDTTLANLPPFTFGQTIDEILTYIDMREIFQEEDLKRVGFNSFSDKIETLDDFDKTKKLYRLKEKEVLNVCAKERKYAKKYFQKLDMLNKYNYVFDCGWNGSSQFFLEQLLKKLDEKTNVEFYYTGIFDTEKSKQQLKDRLFDAYQFQIDDNQELANRLKDSIVLVELFFGAPHNSVLKYTKEGYILDTLEKDTKYKEKILEGLISYFEKAIPIFEKYQLTFDRMDAIKPILRLIEHPTKEEAMTIGNLVNIDGFAYQKNQQKYLAYVTMDQIKQNENIEIYWKQGLLVREDVTEEVKDFVRQKYHMIEKEKVVNTVVTPSYIERFKRSLATNGYRTTLYLLREKIKKKITSKDEYYQWIKQEEKNIYDTEPLSYQPLISFVVPVYNAIREQLIDCIESVFKQTYTNWQLILVDDCSTLEETKEVLQEYTDYDPRIKIEYHKENGHISKTTNDGIKLADGQFIALLDNDDVLAPNALYEMVKKLNEDSSLDFIYSDEDKLTEDGKKRHSPFFKPDWSPDTFLSLMYTCHFAIFRKTIVDKIGGFTVGLDGAQDYDFVLRFTEQTNNIGHISKILYHWRERVGSIASDPKAKPYALNAIVSLKEQALKRRGIKGQIVYEPSVCQYRIVYDAKPKSVDILLKVSNIEQAKITYQTLIEQKEEVVNNIYLLASKEETSILKKEKILSTCLFIDKDNINKKNVWNKMSGELILLLDDTVTLGDKVIPLLAGHALLEHVGMVGPKILWKNTSIIASNGLTPQLPLHVMNEMNDTIPHYYCRNRLDYNCFAVSSSCMMIKKQLLEEISSVLNDELSLSLGEKLLEKGYYHVVRNDAIAYQEKRENMQQQVIFKKTDPFLSKNLNPIDFTFNTKKCKNKRATNNYHKKEIANLTYQVEISHTKEKICFSGYAIAECISHNNSNNVTIVLKNKDNTYSIKTDKVYQPLVSCVYGKNYNFTSFITQIDTRNLRSGTYEVNLQISNRLDKKKIEKRIIEKWEI